MSDKSRAYSDSAITLIIKGDNWAGVRGQVDDMNSLADDLRKANEKIAKLEALLREDADESPKRP